MECILERNQALLFLTTVSHLFGVNWFSAKTLSGSAASSWFPPPLKIISHSFKKKRHFVEFFKIKSSVFYFEFF